MREQAWDGKTDLVGGTSGFVAGFRPRSVKSSALLCVPVYLMAILGGKLHTENIALFSHLSAFSLWVLSVSIFVQEFVSH